MKPLGVRWSVLSFLILPILAIGAYADSITMGTAARFAAGASQASKTGLFNTGVSDSGTPLPSGAIDPHYTLVSSPDGSGPAAFVVIDGQFPFVPFFPGDPAWLPNSSISKWIGPVADARTAIGGPPGQYIFQTTFNLSANQVASAELMGRLASDNSAQVFLNGVNTGMGASGGATCCFDHFTAFQITSGFVQGVNRLDFVVTNNDCGPNCFNPTGIRVEYRLTEVPEPGTVAYYIIFGVLAFMLFRPSQPLWRG